jgi:hypothetical protein
MKPTEEQPTDEPVEEQAAARRRDLNRRLREAFLNGAEQYSRREHGRALTPDELDQVIDEYPGDLLER